MSGSNIMNIFQQQLIASEYDMFYQSKTGKLIDRIEKELIYEYLKHHPGEQMLELGCGTGHWTEFFSEAGFHVTAVDNSEAMLEIAKKKEIKNAVFQKADAENLPFPDNRFKMVTSITMLEFVEDLNQVMNEIDRVLAPGGIIILGCLNALSEIGKNKDRDPVFKYGRFFSPEAVRDLLSGFGVPSLTEGVFLNSDYELMDKTSMQSSVHPVFIAASVQKKSR